MYKNKTIAIMQPYFFPYIGYYGLIANTDRFIIFDPTQFNKKSYMVRNSIIVKNGDKKYINLQVNKHSSRDLIKNIKLNNVPGMFNDLVKQLVVYIELKSPYYKTVIDVLRTCYNDTDSFVEFITNSLVCVCNYIGIPFRYEIYSKMDIVHDEPKHPMDWSLNICKSLGVKCYVNQPGGRAFFNPNRFKEVGIDFHYYEQDIVQYDQRNKYFIPYLSIIDVMMFNTPEQIRNMFKNYRMCSE